MYLIHLLFRIFRIGMFVFIGIPMVLIGIVFAWNMFGRTETREFFSPSGDRQLAVTHDCRFIECFANGEIEYRISGSSASMFCGPFPKEFSDWLFAGDARADWNADETRVSFRRPGEAAAGSDRTIDLVEECRHKVTYTWRNPGPVGFRFEENCLAGTCRRRMVIVRTGSEYLLTPCKVPGTPDSGLLFSTGSDHDPNMHVDFEPEDQKARWTSYSTGISGVVDTARDCDHSRAWREPLPP